MARTFEQEFPAPPARPGRAAGFFAAVDAPPPNPGVVHRAALARQLVDVALSPAAGARSRSSPGEFGAQVLEPLVATLGRDDVRVLPVRNEFFGGNTSVTGLMVGEDLAACSPTSPRAPLPAPDVCVNEGRFLDGHDGRRAAATGGARRDRRHLAARRAGVDR
jgi:hypothetical protein